MTLNELMAKPNPLLAAHGDEEVFLITKVPEEYQEQADAAAGPKKEKFHPHIVADVGSVYVDDAEGFIALSEVEGIAA